MERLERKRKTKSLISEFDDCVRIRWINVEGPRVNGQWSREGAKDRRQDENMLMREREVGETIRGERGGEGVG